MHNLKQLKETLRLILKVDAKYEDWKQRKAYSCNAATIDTDGGKGTWLYCTRLYLVTKDNIPMLFQISQLLPGSSTRIALKSIEV